MAALVIAEHDNASIKGATLNTVTAAIACGGDCLLYTSDAADERSSVDLGGRRIIKKKKHNTDTRLLCRQETITENITTHKYTHKTHADKKETN